MIKDILIIDDEVGIRELLQEILKSNSFQPRHAANGQDARGRNIKAQTRSNFT